jgi:hypothetical protein
MWLGQYVCSTFTSPWCQSEFVLIGKVQEHLTHLQVNASGDLIHSLHRQQCHLQQLLAFPIRRTNIDGHSFSQSFRMHQGSTMNQNPCLSCLARFGHMQRDSDSESSYRSQPTNCMTGRRGSWDAGYGMACPELPAFLSHSCPRCFGAEASKLEVEGPCHRVQISAGILWDIDID